jgi:hypothetical protein
MAISLSNKGRVAIKQQAAWGTAQTSFASTDYLEIEAPFVPTLTQEALRPNTFRPGFTEPEIIAGSKAPTEMSFRFPLHGWSTGGPVADPTAHPDSLIFKTALGSSGSDGYTAALASGSTQTSLNITNGSADTAWEGYGLLVPKSGGYEFAWAKNVDTTVNPDTIELLNELPVVPSSSGTIYGSLTSSLTTAAQLPLTVDYIGSDANTYVRFFDGLPTSVRVVIAAKQLPMCEVTIRFLNWTNLHTGGALADAVYGYPLIPPTIGANGALFKCEDTEFCAATANITITQELSEVECTGSSQGVSQLVATNRQVTAEIVYTQSDLTSIGLNALGDEAGDKSDGCLTFDLATNTPGRAFGMLIARPVLMEQPTIQDLGGKIATRVMIGCAPYTGDDSSTAPADTPFRVAFA